MMIKYLGTIVSFLVQFNIEYNIISVELGYAYLLPGIASWHLRYTDALYILYQSYLEYQSL